MDNLQYLNLGDFGFAGRYCFKPYYKWITFNTYAKGLSDRKGIEKVLNLIING